MFLDLKKGYPILGNCYQVLSENSDKIRSSEQVVLEKPTARIHKPEADTNPACIARNKK